MGRLRLDMLKCEGVLLLRHDGRADGAAVIDFDVAVLGRRPVVEVERRAAHGDGSGRKRHQDFQ